MDAREFVSELLTGLKNTGLLEYIAVLSGIVSVWYSRKENLLVYPTGLLNTSIYIYLSYKGGLLGEATVNVYYTIMSIYGWFLWTRKDQSSRPVLHITHSTAREWGGQLTFFASFYLLIYTALVYLKKNFAPDAIPAADAFASATAFTGMWLMARKKVESWYWWIATNLASIPLYFVKHYVFTSVYYLVLLFMACWGLAAWTKAAGNANKSTNHG